MSQHGRPGYASERESLKQGDIAQHHGSGRASGRESPSSEEWLSTDSEVSKSPNPEGSLYPNLNQIQVPMIVAILKEEQRKEEQRQRRLSNEEVRCEFPPLAAESEIRLLEIDPSDSIDSSEPIRCTFANYAIVPEAFASSRQFDALSYAWGRPELVEAIFLNGKRFWVTENLAEALKRLRYKMKAETGSRPLWVDAVCINQDDVEERSQQVLLMRYIYTRAHLVHIWVGKSVPCLTAFFEKWNQLLDEDEAAGHTSAMGKTPMQTSRDIAAIGPSAVDMLDQSDGTYDGLQYLVSRPWWSRVWVQQEVLLAKTPVFHLDQATYRFGFLLGLLYRIQGWLLHQRPISTVSADAEVEGGIVAKLMPIVNRYLEHTQHEAFSENKMLLRTISSISVICEATDPRDRVYGLLGLLPAEIGILPDYTASVETVFEDAGYLFMKWSNSLDMLLLHGSKNDKLESAPTWIPQFKRSAPAYDFPHPYNPSSSSTCFLERRRPGVLTVRVLQVDRILKWSPFMNDILGEYGHLLSHQDRLRCVLQAWKKLAERTSTQASLDSESSLVFWRAVLQIQGDWVQEQAANPEMTGEGSMAAALQDWLDDHQQAQSEHTFPKETLLRLGICLHRERLLITEEGRYGTATIPENAALDFGDVITILAGSSFPMILRRVTGQRNAYTVVGYCYCEGKHSLDTFWLYYCGLAAPFPFQLDCR